MNTNRQNIKVVCRLRPENTKEKESGCELCINQVSTNTVKINSEDSVQDFTFDKIFGPESQQFDVFEYAARPIIEGAMEGINGTLFCYGQTSSGKTHTMEGKHSDHQLKGIIPRMMEYVFNMIPNASSDVEFTVKCSYLQIYNEKIQDLLDTRKNNLMVKEEKTKGVWVEDATEVYVSSKEEMFDVFKCGSLNRTVSATGMNEQSSRSHSLFIVTIFQKNTLTDSTKSGKLYFVDLAGSEKMSKTGIEGGQGLSEAKNINKSLMMLGMVINALTEGKSHVPYRDSKLTRVLQESLGGNSQTTLIITCSMSAYNFSESLSTLRFGQRAKMIKNKVVANTERSAKELLLRINELEEKIKSYENIILNNGGSNNIVAVDANEKGQCQNCSTAMGKLLNQHIELTNMQEEIEKFKIDKHELEYELKTRNQEHYEQNEKLMLWEFKTKIIIEDQIKLFSELQFKIEQISLVNAEKLLLVNQLKSFESSQQSRLEVLGKLEEYFSTSMKNLQELTDYLSNKEVEISNDMCNLRNEIRIDSSIQDIPDTPRMISQNETPNKESTRKRLNFDSPSQENEANAATEVLKSQRRTINHLSIENRNLQETVSNITMEYTTKLENKIKEYEDIVEALNQKALVKAEEFQAYKERAMNDLEYKEKKMVDLINQISDLEDEKFFRDKANIDKKKFFTLEKQLKQMQIDLQKANNNNHKLKLQNDDKANEIKKLISRTNELSRKYEEEKVKVRDLIRANEVKPEGGMQNLSKLLTAKIKSLGHSSPSSKMEVGNTYNYNFAEQNYNVQIIANNLPESKIMKVIKGGGGGLSTNRIPQVNIAKIPHSADKGEVKSTSSKLLKGLSIEKLNKDKFEQEMKILYNDNMNMPDEVLDYAQTTSVTARDNRDKKSSFWNFFSKIIK